MLVSVRFVADIHVATIPKIRLEEIRPGAASRGPPTQPEGRTMILGKFARLSLAIAATVASATAPAHAGGVIGWATAVNDFSTEGTAVGAAAVVLGILAVGAILMFGITGLITTVVMVCL